MFRNPQSAIRNGITMTTRPFYFRVFATFVRNSLIRDLMFPANFLIEAISSLGWVMMNVGFYLLIFEYTDRIVPVESNGVITDPFAAWDKYQFFVFIATSMFINSIVQMFFMANADEFSELIRTGNLDFALVKPMDTQFLISLRRVEWASLPNFVVAAVLMAYALPRVDAFPPHIISVLLYFAYVAMGVAILYSLTIVLAAASVWLGRNSSIYDFWFYITTFSRYPMEIYTGPAGIWLQRVFTFVLPILIVVNVPARLLAKPLQPAYAYLAGFGVLATLASLAGSRWVFQRALASYRSASS
jgi:ABC-2 type transport system permease protein